MKILDFIELVDLKPKTELEQAKLRCFYHYKETGEFQFTMAVISSLMEQCGFNAPNTSRLKDKLISGKTKAMLETKGVKNIFEFVPAFLQQLEKEFGALWNETEKIESSRELIEEAKFCGKR